MSEKKAPIANSVSAQALQDLRDLCQPSNFNTSEQALSALHNGISGLLNKVSMLEMDPKRLQVGDKFYVIAPAYGDEPYEVYNRITVHSSKMTLVDGAAEHASASNETYIAFGKGNWHCYLKLSNLTSYFNMSEDKIHMEFPKKVLLISQL